MSDSALTLADLLIWKGNFKYDIEEGSSVTSKWPKSEPTEPAFNGEISYVRSFIDEEKEKNRNFENKLHREQLLQKLKDIEAIGEDWNENAKGPNDFAIAFSKDLIDQFVENNFIPNRLTQSIEEGVSFVFSKGKLFLYLEIYNDAEMGVLVEDYENKSVLKNKEVSSQQEILEEISEFFDYV